MSKIQGNIHTTDIFIKNAIEIWNDRYDYSKVVYKDSNTKVIIICKKHGEFEQISSNHYKYGCGRCGREMNVRNNYLKEKHNLKLFAFEYDLVTNHYPDILTDGFYIVSGKIEGGLEHSVIYKNGELVHDSNPKKNKIIELECIYLFIKIFK